VGRVGWATSAWAFGPTYRSLPEPVAMRAANIGRWLNRHERGLQNELYRPGHSYDVVVFVKAMDEPTRAEAELIKEAGGRVVFDANVNYYEIWGDYELPSTRPTEEQQRDAIAMTRLADWVVADSSYLLEIVRKYTDRASWVPDNVDTRIFRPPRRRRRAGLVAVWSGMASKARPLLDIREPLASAGAELVVVSNEEPAELAEVQRDLAVRFVKFSLRRYAQVLREADVIVSPKRLVNGYELGHTEWKITLGMAVGLPAVASPQRSYVEAIGHRGGGFVAGSNEEWRDALERLRDPSLRAELGGRARETVVERYSTPVIAQRYLDVLPRLL
jgi:glycosyltransferase involved in cell wall biosynthesis